MDQYSTTEARKILSDLVSRVEFGKERVAFTRRDRVVAVLIPVEELEILEDAIDEIIAERAFARHAAEGGPLVPHDEIRRIVREESEAVEARPRRASSGG